MHEVQPPEQTTNDAAQVQTTDTPAVEPLSLARRHFLLWGGGLTASTLLANWASRQATTQTPISPLPAPALPAAPPANPRLVDAYNVRMQAAERLHNTVIATHPTNGDEALYPSGISCYSKGLPHNTLGEVELTAYQAFFDAMNSKSSCEEIPLGGKVKLANPQAAFAFQLEGMDTHNLTMPPAPAFASADLVAELVELYWQAITRDVPFS